MHKAAAHAKRGLPLRHLPAMDLPFLVLVLTLVGFGLVMLGSASSAVALYRRGDAFAYLRPQLLYAALGIGAMWVASRVDYHVYHKLAWPLLALSMVLLTAVLFMPEYNGCKRWLVLPGLGVGVVESTHARNKLSRNATFLLTIAALAALIFFVALLLHLNIDIR